MTEIFTPLPDLETPQPVFSLEEVISIVETWEVFATNRLPKPVHQLFRTDCADLRNRFVEARNFIVRPKT